MTVKVVSCRREGTRTIVTLVADGPADQAITTLQSNEAYKEAASAARKSGVTSPGQAGKSGHYFVKADGKRVDPATDGASIQPGWRCCVDYVFLDGAAL